MEENLMGVNNNLEDWVFAISLFFIGFVVLKLIKFNGNTITGKFLLSFWVKDNFKEFILGLIVVYISFRFQNLVNKKLIDYLGIIIFSNKFLFTCILSISINVVFEKLRSKLGFKAD
jgi:hypothetical protein